MKRTLRLAGALLALAGVLAVTGPSAAQGVVLVLDSPAPAHHAGAASCGTQSCCCPQADCAETPQRFWGRGEYLLWWLKEDGAPPLLTTSPPTTKPLPG